MMGRPTFIKGVTVDEVLELLEQFGFIVDGRAAFNEDTMRPYTKLDMSKRLAKYFGYKSESPRHVYSLVNLAQEEFNLYIPTRGENTSLIHALNGREQDHVTEVVRIHTGEVIDLDALNLNHKAFNRWRSNWNALRKRVRKGLLTEKESAILFLDYYKRKIKNPEEDGRHNKPYNNRKRLKELEGQSQQ